MDYPDPTATIVDAALCVHRHLGPGLLESTYEACLCHELSGRGLWVERQKPLPVAYCGVRVDCGYRVDLLVEGKVIIELKTVERFEPIHTAQLLTYLRLARCAIGLLLNFNVVLMKDGIKRVVNNYQDPSSRPLRTLR
ncbi:MAG TPA: GxxExxY protein [Longimicrobiales bacterium]|nr:GxxExxY protein [Longimicrobiales bacterium]